MQIISDVVEVGNANYHRFAYIGALIFDGMEAEIQVTIVAYILVHGMILSATPMLPSSLLLIPNYP